MRNKFIIILICAFALTSCDLIQSIIHDEDVAAKVGKHKLYMSELQEYIPDGLSPEDSSAMAARYIESWAAEQLYMDKAEKELAKQQKDIDKEMETYRKTLLRFRYEQQYLEEKLDTTVTDEEIEKYYDEHQDQFKLSFPILKARLAVISEASPNIEEIKEGMSSEDSLTKALVDSLAFRSALRYTDYGGQWINASVLAREFGTDYVDMLSRRQDGYVEMSQDGNEIIAYVISVLRTGETSPLEYNRKQIKDIVLNARKQELLDGLEQELLEEARAQGDLIVY